MHFFQKNLPGYTVELNAEGYLRCIGINYLVQDFVDIYALLKGPWMDEMLWIAHQVTVPREP